MRVVSVRDAGGCLGHIRRPPLELIGVRAGSVEQDRSKLQSYLLQEASGLKLVSLRDDVLIAHSNLKTATISVPCIERSFVASKIHKHVWEWIGQTYNSQYEFCNGCGAIKRVRGARTSVFRRTSAARKGGRRLKRV